MKDSDLGDACQEFSRGLGSTLAGASCRSHEGISDQSKSPATGLQIQSQNIESTGPIERILGQVPGRCPGDATLLGRGDGFDRRTVGLGCAGLDLYEAESITFAGDDVYLACFATEVALVDQVALTAQPLDADIFAGLSPSAAMRLLPEVTVGQSLSPPTASVRSILDRDTLRLKLVADAVGGREVALATSLSALLKERVDLLR